ncbi:MAG TPA: hypothetical protein VK172_10340 [Lentimicrobium sp.]|nr:hypothetical protein [Lentimicrobium sp.]
MLVKPATFELCKEVGLEIKSKPSQSFLAKLLRDLWKLQVYAYSSTKNGVGNWRDYVAYINGEAQNDARDEEFQTYESAMEYGLRKALLKLKASIDAERKRLSE